MKLMLNLLVFFITQLIFAQKTCNEFYHHTFTKQQLEQDIDFMREKIINAHVSPFTEISKDEFEKKYKGIRNALKDGMTQKDFYFAARPLIVTLNDEHSGISDYCVTDSMKNAMKVLPLKFAYDNGKMILTENYSDSRLNIGDELVSLNDMPIAEVLKNCASTVPGAKEERIPIVVDRFWIMINKFCYFITDNYHLKFAGGLQTVVKSISLEQLKANVSKDQKPEQKKSGPVTYKKIKDFGYLTVNTFNEKRSFPMEGWKIKFDSLFTQIRKDGVKKLVIDVHENSGGNSGIGNLLITYFSDKTYNTYQGRWKKSREYADYLRTDNKLPAEYEKLKDGDYYPIKSRSVKPSANALRFSGKTYVVVGKNTFSSAMMFGAVVLDNKLAEVVGEIPEKGHPNHFGELISFKTPNTKLEFFFGVKEWIRPAGNIQPNKLIPDRQIELKDKTEEQIVEQL